MRVLKHLTLIPFARILLSSELVDPDEGTETIKSITILSRTDRSELVDPDEGTETPCSVLTALLYRVLS